MTADLRQCLFPWSCDFLTGLVPLLLDTVHNAIQGSGLENG